MPTIKTFTDPNTNKVVAIVNNEASRDQSVSIQSAKTRQVMSAQEKESRSIQSSDKFLLEKGHILGIKNVSSELYPSEVTTDSIGTTVVRNAQRYNGVNVYGAEIITVLNSRLEVLSTNGRFLEGINLDTNPQINSSKVVKLATRDMEKRYGWKRIITVEKRAARKFCRNKPNATLCVNKKLKKFKKAKGFYSLKAPELFIYNEKYLLGEVGGENHLAWNLVMIGADDVSDAYFIDAQTGTVLNVKETAHQLNRKIYDCSGIAGNGCWSNLFPGHASYPAQYNPYTFGRIEGAPERNGHPVAAFLGTTDTDKSYDISGEVHAYINTRFGRNGANNQGGMGSVASGVPVGNTHIEVNLNGITPNPCTSGSAWWEPSQAEIRLCLGNATSDTLAHEYTHAVQYYLNKLQTYSGQTGALNESHADVFGQIFEASLPPTNSTDWLIYADGELVRSLGNPSAYTYRANSVDYPFPDNYNSPTFWCGSADNYGVHVNSPVPSYAAYLASEGGFNNGCTIVGIGKDRVEQIWYRALSTYYTNSTTFFEAYQGLTTACNDLVGNQTPEMVELGINITADDCNSVARALQSVEMDKQGGCIGDQPANLEHIPTCIDPTPEFSADFNADEVIDLLDYQILRGRWTYPNEAQRLLSAPPEGDANGDGLVDMIDYDIFKAQYESSNPGMTAPPAPTMIGDLNLDGIINFDDYTNWKNSNGQTGVALLADTDVNGVVNHEDIQMWASHYPSGNAADYNGDGFVDLYDYNKVKQQWGAAVAGLSSDINADSTVDSTDYEVWAAVYNQSPMPPVPTLRGDCNGLELNSEGLPVVKQGNGYVDGSDFLGWQRGFGSSGPAMACDFNADGSMDAADYTVWRDNYGASLNPPDTDFNNDGVTDLKDWDLLRQQWGQTGALSADSNTDGVVNSIDYSNWLNAYGQTPAPPQPTLRGDYNFDGDVDGDDYNVWRSNFGTSGAAIGADGNIDGVVDLADYTVWRDNLGATINAPGSLSIAAGDCNFDGYTSGSDFLAWQRQVGSTLDLACDFNGDGTVDSADLTIWQNNYGN